MMSPSSLPLAAPAVRRPGTASAPSWPMRLARAIVRDYRARRGTAALADLDDRLLHDIGLDRSAIAYAARFGRC